MRSAMVVVLLLVVASLMAACGEGDPSFSLLADNDVFIQNKNETNTKVDILWVIDNSGSMETSQDNLVENFEEFIDGFRDRNFDFQMAVTTTDAYLSMFSDDPNDSKFRDGTDATSHTGQFIVNPWTPNFESVFLTNVLQGVSGYGDERAFSSFRETLNNSLNTGFLRENSFLAIIIVSDEDDFSHNSSFFTNNYNYSGMDTIESYKDYLDEITNSTEELKRYSVSAMAIFDEECRQELNNTFSGRRIGLRYEQLIDLTGGEKGSLCDNFAESLNFISEGIIQLATQFYLSRIPVPETISVIINGQVIPEFTGVGPANGWMYNPESNSVMFFGTAVPAQGSQIDINYDPVAVGQ